MATGGFDSSIKGGHDIVPDCPCNKCEESDIFTEAIAYCMHCDEKYCKVCLTYHGRFTKGHTVLGQADKDGWEKPIMSRGIGVECSEHEGQDISMYCGKHDDVCCPVCAVQHHSDKCRPKMLYIRKAAEGIATTADYRRVLADNDQLTARITQTEDKKSELLTTVAESHKSCKTDAEELGKRLVKHINSCTGRTIAHIDKLHNDVEGKLTEEIDNCGDMKQRLNEIKANMQPRSPANEASIFITTKNSKKNIKSFESSLGMLSKSQTSKFSFQGSPTIQQLFRLVTLGDCTEHATREADSVVDDDTSEKEQCVICMDDMTDPRAIPCGHRFCRECIEKLTNYKPICPTCFKVYGAIKGDQPNGTMQDFVDKARTCAGYDRYATIVIQYRFPSGVQQGNHPRPGARYEGIQRTAYLPDNRQGNIVLEMLKIAWERKLVFTIGTSRMTGQEGVITWNGIHHKTNMAPHGKFGYPDPDYLQRVTEELAVKGVKEEEDIPLDRLRDINRRFSRR